MIGAAMAENPAVMTASGWKQNKNGNWEQKRTSESNKLADNLAVISWMSPTHPGTAAFEKAIGIAAKYGMNVYNRFRFANTKLAPVSEISKVLEKRLLPKIDKETGARYYAEPGYGTWK